MIFVANSLLNIGLFKEALQFFSWIIKTNPKDKYAKASILGLAALDDLGKCVTQEKQMDIPKIKLEDEKLKSVV